MNIYTQHGRAFSQVSAFVITKGKERVATVAIKFPRDGAGRLWAYVHWLGVPMVRGYAGGYGYDKSSAAVSSAASRVELQTEHVTKAQVNLQKKFIKAASLDNGYDWQRNIEDAGFYTLQAV